MAPPNNGNRRPGSRPSGRPALDEIMEINTGDVMPLVDEDLIEVLNDDAPPVRAASSPTMLPDNDRSAAKPQKVAKPTLDRGPIRRPQVKADEPQETAVMMSLPAREEAIADKGYSNAFVYVDKGPGAGQLVPILQGEMIIGRSTESGLQLNHPSVSRSHATLIRRGETYFVRDNGSQNGTFVNWAKLKGEAEVFPGDQISIGTAVIIVRGGVYNSTKRRLPPPQERARPADVSIAPPRAKGKAKAETPWGLIVGVGGASLALGMGLVFWLASGHNEKADTSSSAASNEEKRVPEAKIVQAIRAEEKAAAPKAEPKTETKLAAVDKPAVTPAPASDEVNLNRGSPRHTASASHAAKRAEKAAEAAATPPAPTGAGAPPAALKLYEAGNIDGAISTAESAGATAAATKMVQFKTAYEAGKAALAAKNGGGAISNLGKALKLDEQINQGWGKLNGEIRGQMAGLYLLAGNQAQGRGDNETAAKAYKAALGFQPANAEARRKLAEVGGGGPAPKKAAPGAAPAAGNPRSAADAAFDN